MGLDRTDSLAVLDALTPAPGWTTDLALLSSYSVDLVAAAAVIVALAGEGDDHERMKQAPLARACERMRDRFRIVCQAGRITVPGAGATALVLADRWVREVHHDGNERSWHAKLAFVRYIRQPAGGAQPEVTWRMWVGSRNLTRDTSWDSALIAEGRPASVPAPSVVEEGIAGAGGVLASRASLPGWPAERVREELRGLQWTWPADVVAIQSFALWPDASPAPGFPKAPGGLQRMVAAGPFVDGASAKALGAWGGADARRQLLTIPGTLATLAPQAARPLAGFTTLHQLDAPTAPDDAEADRDETGEDQMVEVHRGLHAKLIWARTNEGDHLWLGSANLTERAWDGRNTEIALRLRVAPSVGKGLCEGLVEGLATEVLSSELPTVAPAEDEDDARIDALRNRIAGAWTAVLRTSGDDRGLELTADAAPLLSADNASLNVRLLGTKDSRSWAAGEKAVRLPAVPLHQQTELVELTLSANGTGGPTVAWVARAPLDPEPGIGRDRAVLSRLMGPRAFLAWLRALLDEIMGESGEQHWPERERRQPSNHGGPMDGGILLVAPTLEAVLRAWTRDPVLVRHVDRAISTWAEDIRSSIAEDADEAERAALAELQRFEEAWRIIRVGLGLDEEEV